MTLSFAKDIKPMFTDGDQACMEFAFDLWKYEDVKKHAQGIYDKVADGSMPQGGDPWSPDWVAKFKQWMNDGYPA